MGAAEVVAEPPQWVASPCSEACALERLTQPREMVERQQGAAEREEGAVDVRALLIADGEAPHLVEMGERALYHPAVAPEPRARVDAAPRDAREDPPLAQQPAR